MDLTYLYLGLALAAGAGIFLYFSPFRAAKKPKTDTLFTEALNAMVRGDKAVSYTHLTLPTICSV